MNFKVRLGWWGGCRSGRWVVALAAWGALLFLAAPLLHSTSHEPHVSRNHNARLLLQSELSSTPPPQSKEPALDKRVLSEDVLRQEAEDRLPSLPLTYWHKNKDKKNKYFKNKECAPFPSIYDLSFDNVYWQSMKSTNGTFHFFGAYYDERNASLIGPAVRILSVHDRIKPILVTHCQLWFDDRDEPIIVRNLEYKYIWNAKWGNYKNNILQPYLLACVIPKEVRGKIPASVSIVEKPCDKATTNLRVYYNRPEKKKGFAVCVKGLDFQHEDLSVRLVEWIEILRILGAEKIFFYQLQVHSNISRVLDYYTAQDVVKVTPITLPGGQPNLPGLQHMYLKKKTTSKRQNELIPYNDCLYKNMYSFQYIALLDIDEVIVPLLDMSWSDLMKRILPKSKVANAKVPRSSYHASNVYFLDSLQHAHGWLQEVPKHLHMLQHVYRTKNFTKPGQYVKAFHDPERVLALHNHFPLACLGGACSSYAIDTTDAQLQHYRADCVTALSKTCAKLREEVVRDESIWKWRDQLVTRSNSVLNALGYFNDVR